MGSFDQNSSYIPPFFAVFAQTLGQFPQNVGFCPDFLYIAHLGILEIWAIARKDEFAQKSIFRCNAGLRFICDLREINKRLVRKPYPLPKVQDLLRKIGKFKYATTLDLVMGFYNITMDEEAQRICTLILPWGKYRLTRLAMGLVIAPDVFQARIHDIFHDLGKGF
jgi:hypothetical protein